MSLPMPQVLVFQDFTLLPTEIVDPLRPFLFGPEYKLHRYSVAAEKVQSGIYNSLGSTTLTWAGLGASLTGVVDQTYTKVYLENARLRYYSGAGVGVIVSQTKNRVYCSSLVLQSGNGSVLSGAFSGRDVAVGDYARIYATVSSVLYEVTAKITGFVADVTASSIAAATADSGNGPSQTATALGAMSNLAGTSTSITAATTGTYNGITSGKITETYTIEVVRSTTGNDLRTAVLNIISGSGTDDVLGYVPTVNFGSAFPMGTRGLSCTMTNGSSINLVIGNKFTITVRDAYEVISATKGGTYTGSKSTTYILTATRGGTIGADTTTCPMISVQTTTGVDTTSPIYVTADATLLPVGNYGVTASFDGTAISGSKKIRKGDRWFITVTAAGPGAIRTLILDKSLPANLITGSPALSVDLLLAKDVMELKPTTTSNTGYSINWTQSGTSIVLQSAATVTDTRWLAGTVSLPVVSGDVYINWRELVTSHADRIYSVDSIEDLVNKFDTAIDPDNPLVYAINKALLNSNGTGVRAMGVPTNDLAGFTTVLAKAELQDDIYSLVPLTTDVSVLQQVSGHVQALSSPTRGLWRIAWVSSKIDNPGSVVKTLGDGVSDVTAVFSLNGSYYDVELTSTALAGTASFANVRIGDKVRVNFATNDAGQTVYQELTVASVESAEVIKVIGAPDPFTSQAVKVEVWRVLKSDDLTDAVSTSSGRFSSRRVYNVYPDTFESGGVAVPGYFMAAALAGLRGGVAPHQGLTNVTLTGFDNANNSVNVFNRTQMETMAGNGVWLITHDLKDGSVYTWQEVSTDNTDLNTREQMVTTNVDSISKLFRKDLAKYIGRANVTPSLIQSVDVDMQSTINYLKVAGYTERLGGQLIEAKIVSLATHPLLKDRLVAVIDLDIPYSVNHFELHLVV